MNRPLEIRDVENISLEASDSSSDVYPQLVAQFTCQYEANSDCINLGKNIIICMLFSCLDDQCDTCCY